MNKWFVGLALVAIAVIIGCSQESREEAIDRTKKAAQALNGDSKAVDKEHDVPNVVAEQKRKEIIRQNTKWTKENQSLHPIEYCQAQLEELDRMSKALQVQVHSIATAKAAMLRERDDAVAQVESFGKLLKDAKATYRAAEAANAWPMVLNGFQLSRERAEQKIVDMAQRISTQKSFVEKSKNMLASLEAKSVKLDGEQRKLGAIREKVQTTLEDLKTKQVVDGANGVADALNAINDSMSSLGIDAADPTIDELVVPTGEVERTRLFQEIMAEE